MQVFYSVTNGGTTTQKRAVSESSRSLAFWASYFGDSEPLCSSCCVCLLAAPLPAPPQTWHRRLHALLHRLLAGGEGTTAAKAFFNNAIILGVAIDGPTATTSYVSSVTVRRCRLRPCWPPQARPSQPDPWARRLLPQGSPGATSGEGTARSPPLTAARILQRSVMPLARLSLPLSTLQAAFESDTAAFRTKWADFGA